MIKVVPFDPVHMDFCDFHESCSAQAAREDPEALAKSIEAWSLIDDESGSVIAIVGMMGTYNRCAYLWSYMSKHAGRHMTRITRFVADLVARMGLVRIEATVLKDAKPAHRWMRLLGFKRETSRPMKLWDGVSDFHLYSLVAR